MRVKTPLLQHAINHPNILHNTRSRYSTYFPQLSLITSLNRPRNKFFCLHPHYFTTKPPPSIRSRSQILSHSIYRFSSTNLRLILQRIRARRMRDYSHEQQPCHRFYYIKPSNKNRSGTFSLLTSRSYTRTQS